MQNSLEYDRQGIGPHYAVHWFDFHYGFREEQKYTTIL